MHNRFLFPLTFDKTDPIYLFLTSWQIGIVIRAAASGHLPNYGFVLVSLGSTAVLLITFRALLYAILPVDNSKKSDDYRRGSPFELFEVYNPFIFVRSQDILFLVPLQSLVWKNRFFILGDFLKVFRYNCIYINLNMCCTSTTSVVSMNLCL